MTKNTGIKNANANNRKNRAMLRHVAEELAGLRNTEGFYRMTRFAQTIVNELLAKVESHLGDDLPGPGERMPDGSHDEGNLAM